jgi:hypothetical protein
MIGGGLMVLAFKREIHNALAAAAFAHNVQQNPFVIIQLNKCLFEKLEVRADCGIHVPLVLLQQLNGPIPMGTEAPALYSTTSSQIAPQSGAVCPMLIERRQGQEQDRTGDIPIYPTN